MEQSTRFVGMDVHKDTIVVAVTATGDVGKATAYGKFPNTAASLQTLVKRLRQAGDGPIKFCYEAGPCGYGVSNRFQFRPPFRVQSRPRIGRWLGLIPVMHRRDPRPQRSAFGVARSGGRGRSLCMTGVSPGRR
jgi:hypothetical protein